jgi:prepilin-type N-terminal cleavage/methylation domain-containing protein
MSIKKKHDKKKGFTIIEIVIVGIILSILATMALPRFQITIEKSRTTEAIQILQALRSAQEAYKFENGGNYTTNIDRLDVRIPNPPTNFNYPTVQDGSTLGIIATITRNTGSYTFKMANVGTISCAERDAGTCSKVGY